MESDFTKLPLTIEDRFFNSQTGIFFFLSNVFNLITTKYNHIAWKNVRAQSKNARHRPSISLYRKIRRTHNWITPPLSSNNYKFVSSANEQQQPQRNRAKTSFSAAFVSQTHTITQHAVFPGTRDAIAHLHQHGVNATKSTTKKNI